MTGAVETGAVEIRLVDADAWRTWRDIRLRALVDAPAAFGSTYEREAAFGEAEYRARLGPSGPAVLGWADGTAVGMGAGYQDVEGWLHVVAMWVDPCWRGRQVGRGILEQIVGWASEHGLRSHLDVTLGNDAARRLYEDFGFVGTGCTEPLRPGSSYTIERMVLP